MSNPIEKLDVLFDGEDWTKFYAFYTNREPFPRDPSRQNDNLVDSIVRSNDDSSFSVVQLKIFMQGKSSEFVTAAANLFDELFYLQGNSSPSATNNNLSPAIRSQPRVVVREPNNQELPSLDTNIVGQFRMSDSSGNFIDYVRGDVVYYEGKTYIASRNVSGWVPESKHPENGWQPIDLPDETIDGSEF